MSTLKQLAKSLTEEFPPYRHRAVVPVEQATTLLGKIQAELERKWINQNPPKDPIEHVRYELENYGFIYRAFLDRIVRHAKLAMQPENDALMSLLERTRELMQALDAFERARDHFLRGE